MKENADLLEKGDQNLLGKEFRSHIVEIERSKERTLEVFTSRNRSAPPSAKKALLDRPFTEQQETVW